MDVACANGQIEDFKIINFGSGRPGKKQLHHQMGITI